MSQPDRYCSQCGATVLAPDEPHAATACDDCGRTRYETADGSGHLRVGKDGRITFPAGSLSVSLDPTRSSGRFTRAGIAFHFAMLFAGDLPASIEDLEGTLAQRENAALAVLRASDSELLSDLDLETDEGMVEAATRLREEEHQHTIEAQAIKLAALCVWLRRDANEHEGSQEAILMALRAGALDALVRARRTLHELVWQGYQRETELHDLRAARPRATAEEERILVLSPLFRERDERVLRVWLDDDQPIASRLGIDDGGITERGLRAMAQHELDLRERERSERAQKENRQIQLGQLQLSRRQAAAAVAVPAVTAGGLIVGVIMQVWG